jgi:hypothetical protein
MENVSKDVCDVRVVPADPNDSDVIISPPTEPEPTWDVMQARKFGRAGDQRRFDIWLAGQTSDLHTWQRLRAEFNRARSDQESLPAWKRAWREGLVPQLTCEGLEGLRKALERDDVRICTGVTTEPPPLSCMEMEPLEKCCPLCFALLEGKSPAACSVGLMESCFARVCFRCSELCGEPGAVRWFLNAVDEWSRPDLIANLLPEVIIAITSKTLTAEKAEPETPLARKLRESIELVRRNGTT